MQNLKQQILELFSEIEGDIHHGECFYDREMLNYFIENLEEMKRLAIGYYSENQRDDG